MCGRFVLTTPAEALRQAFGFIEQPNLARRYNIAPTQDVPVIRQRKEPAGQRSLQMLRWGLVPSWEDSFAGGAKMINARAETVREKPAFHRALARRRCLVAADGFYEWRPGDKAKQPYLITTRDGTPLAFAGLWERWSPPPPESGLLPADGDAARRAHIDSFTTGTATANAALATLHPRLPGILAPADNERRPNPAAGPPTRLP